jgi:hypothetical protein
MREESEVRSQKSEVSSWRFGLPALACLILLLWVLAYQLPFALHLAIGGDMALQRRDDDAPFLNGFHGSEPYSSQNWRFWELSPGYTYRWTEPEARIVVPGVGQGRFVVSLLAQSGRATGAPTQWTIGDSLIYGFVLPEPPADLRRYHFLATSDARGDLQLQLNSRVYEPPGEPRALGFVLRDVQIRSAQGWMMPAWAQLSWLMLSIALIAATSALLLPTRFSHANAAVRSGNLQAAIFLRHVPALLAFGLALVAAYLLAFHRTALTLFTPTLAALTASCGVFGLAAWALKRRLALSASFMPIAALVILSFVLRLGGILHPQAMFSDARFNANNFLQVGLGEIFFTAGLPADAGGGEAPYPPGVYILLLPLQFLFANTIDGRVLLMQSGTALLDSLVLAMIAIMLLRAGLRMRAALFASACYVLPPPLLESFSIGEYANLGGQALAMIFVTLLACGLLQNQRTDHGSRITLPTSYPLPTRSTFDALCSPLCALYSALAALILGLLVHSGVTLSLGLFTAAAWGVAVLGALRRRPSRVRQLTLVAALALGFTIIAYYSAPIFLQAIAARGEGLSTAGRTPLQVLSDTALSLLGLAKPPARGNPIPLALGLVNFVGLVLLWRRRDTASAALRFTLLAWWLGMLLSLGLQIVAGQGVRWILFIYPALCIAAGYALDRLWQRGPAGRVAATLALASIIVYGLSMWVTQIRDYFHI